MLPGTLSHRTRARFPTAKRRKSSANATKRCSAAHRDRESDDALLVGLSKMLGLMAIVRRRIRVALVAAISAGVHP